MNHLLYEPHISQISRSLVIWKCCQTSINAYMVTQEQFMEESVNIFKTLTFVMSTGACPLSTSGP